MIRKKNIRYFFWLIGAFFKKYRYLIFLSFFISFLTIVFFVSLSPYIEALFIKQEVIGLIGRYSLENPPEEISKKISNGLLSINQKGKIISVLARSWEEKDQGKKFRFYLRDNLYWSDGKKFVASDVNYHFNDVEIKIIDDLTIEFILKKPLAIFPIYLDKPLIRYPLKGLIGYYRVGKIKQEGGYLKEVILVPNLKNLTTIKYKFYFNESQLITAYKKGEVRSISLNKKSLAESFFSWKNTIVDKKVDYSKLLTIFFNFKNSYFENKDVRHTLSLILNDEGLSQYGLPAKQSIPPVSWAFNDSLKARIYNLETAEKFFSANKPASNSSELTFATFFDYYDIADEIVSEMKKLGLNVNLKIVSQIPDDFDFFMAYLKVPEDPDQYYFWHSTQTQSNLGGYKNMKVDLLLEKGRSTLNLEERKKYYLDFQKTLQDDPPALFLYYPYVYEIRRK